MAERLEIVIDARDNASGVLRGVATNAQGSFAGMSQSIQAHAGEIRMAGMAVTAFGVGVVATAGKCVSALGGQERAQAKLSAAIEGTAQAIDQSRLEKLAADLQQVTTFGDEATIEMMALLTTFGLTQEQIEGLAPRIQNISAMMGTDLAAAAVAVGKAISQESASALNRYGIIIDEATMKSGNFNGILQAIDANTGPAAEKLAQTADGAIKQFKNAMGDTAEAIGAALVPAIETLTPLLQTGAEVMGKIAETPLGKFFIVSGVALGALSIPLGALLMMLPTLAAGWDRLSGAHLRNAAAANVAATANTRLTATAVTATGAVGMAGTGLAARMLGYGGGALALAKNPYVAGAAVVGIGAYYGLSKWQGGADEESAAVEATGPAEGFYERHRDLRLAEMSRAMGYDLAAPFDAIPPPAAVGISAATISAEPEWTPRNLAGIAELSPGAFRMPTARRPALPSTSPIASEDELSVAHLRQVAPGRYELIIELQPHLQPGELADGVTDWMADLAYAEQVS